MRVIGAQMVGGRVVVQYLAGGPKVEAANAGDYIYPSDIRLDSPNDLVYVKASGLAGGISYETWLFEYDLKGEKLVSHRRVRDDVLPAECVELSRLK